MQGQCNVEHFFVREDEPFMHPSGRAVRIVRSNSPQWVSRQEMYKTGKGNLDARFERVIMIFGLQVLLLDVILPFPAVSRTRLLYDKSRRTPIGNRAIPVFSGQKPCACFSKTMSISE